MSILIPGNRRHTINYNITNGIDQIFLIFRLAIVCSKTAGPVPKNGIALRQNLAIRHLDNGNVAAGIHLRHLRAALMLGPFGESVAHIGESSAGILAVLVIYRIIVKSYRE